MRLNRNTERRQKCHARRQQIKDSTEIICSADSKHEVDTRVSPKQHEDRVSVLERESRVLQQRGVLQQRVVCAKRETHILMAPKHAARILSVPEREARVLTKRKGHVST